MSNFEELLNYNNSKAYKIFDFVIEKFPDKNRIESSRDLIQHGEAPIALESLCENIIDYEITLPANIYTELVDVCRFFDVAEEYWKNILHE